MNTRPKYQTKQRKILLEYLETVPGEHVTANDVCEHCKSIGAPIGQSTIYRQLESLADEGIVNKYTIDGNSPACFEYLGENCHRDKETCFHFKCEKCGQLLHMHSEELEHLMKLLAAEKHFRIDPIRTVFYGWCENCKGE